MISGTWTVARKKNRTFPNSALRFEMWPTKWTWPTVWWEVSFGPAPDRPSSQAKLYVMPTCTPRLATISSTIPSATCSERQPCWWVSEQWRHNRQPIRTLETDAELPLFTNIATTVSSIYYWLAPVTSCTDKMASVWKIIKISFFKIV